MVLIFRGWKPSRILVALVLLFASVTPLYRPDKVEAALLQNRLIKMSSSARGDVTTGIAPGDDAVYEVDFDITTGSTIRGVIVDFCVDSPIINDTCTAPSGFDLKHTTLSYSASAGMTNLTHNTTGASSDTNTLLLTNATGWTASANDSGTFTLGTGSGDGVTNPIDTDTGTVGNQVGTFYARIITFDSVAGAEGYVSNNFDVGDPGSDIDAGGIALSTAEQVIVTAKVAERLEFCVYVDADFATTPPTNDCLGKSGSAINLGDSNSVLDPNGEFINKEAFYGVTTNASGSVSIRLKGNTLQNGSNDIDAIGATPATTSPGAEQFGLCNYEFDSIDSNLVPTAGKYDGEGLAATDCQNTTHNAGTATAGGAAGDADFAFDSTETTSTYGDAIVSKPAGNFSTGNLVFIANISNTTVAGIYTTTLTFIATGTY